MQERTIAWMVCLWISNIIIIIKGSNFKNSWQNHTPLVLLYLQLLLATENPTKSHTTRDIVDKIWCISFDESLELLKDHCSMDGSYIYIMSLNQVYSMHKSYWTVYSATDWAMIDIMNSKFNAQQIYNAMTIIAAR